jgi:hypothetical protein
MKIVKTLMSSQDSLPQDVKNEVLKIVKDESKSGIYSFIIFTQKFCK